MVRRKGMFGLVVSVGLLCSGWAVAQENGRWRAMSTTARGITGDIAVANEKLTMNFMRFTIAEIRALEPGEMTALFSAGDADGGRGHLYRLEIPGDTKFLHKNTLCGSEETQWMATYGTGHDLQLAFFSGPKMPVLTAEAVTNSTNLCGTFSYTR